MTLRVTRQNIEALVVGDTSKARVSRCYIQVLARDNLKEVQLAQAISASDAAASLMVTASNVITVSDYASTMAEERIAANAILITDAAVVEHLELTPAVSNTFTITDVAREVRYTEEIVSNAFIITDSAVAELKELSQSVFNTFTIVDAADVAGGSRSPWNHIEIADEATATLLVVHGASNAITISDSVETHLHVISASNAITITDAAIGANLSVYASISNAIEITDEAIATATERVIAENHLITYHSIFDPVTGIITVGQSGLQDAAQARVTTYNRSLTNTITVSQAVSYELVGATSFEVNASNTIEITDSVAREYDVENTITVIDLAEAELWEQPKNRIEISDSVSVQKNLGPKPTNTIAIAQTVKVDKTKSVFCYYDPLIGSSTDPDAPTPPPTTVPRTTRAEQVTFTQGVNELVLRLPNLGNHDRLDFTRVNRESRGGNLIIYADPVWPKTQNYQLDFYGCTETEAQEVLTFIEATLGKEIIFWDWESNSWYCFITNPDTAVVREIDDSFIVALELDVIVDTTELAGASNSISVSQSVAGVLS